MMFKQVLFNDFESMLLQKLKFTKKTDLKKQHFLSEEKSEHSRFANYVISNYFVAVAEYNYFQG